MKMRTRVALVVVAVVALGGGTRAIQAQEKTGECRFFSGLPHYTIQRAENQDVGSHTFLTTDGGLALAGKLCVREYGTVGATTTGAQIVRTYFNAVHAKVGKDFFNDLCPESLCAGRPGMRLLVGAARFGDQEVWLEVLADGDGAKYTMTELSSDHFSRFQTAALLLANLTASGRTALQLDFEPARATLRPEAVKAVEQIALLLEQNPELTLTIEGHTTEMASRPGNQKLSEARANAVVEALKARGVAEARLKAIGLGQTQPIAANTTLEGQFLNQRIELVKR
jgi:outer membrane protein OmpA-like peptidoglycan-associated protein